MKRAAAALVIAVLLAAPAAVFAAEPFTASLTGAAETPPVETEATGTANATISDDASSIEFEVTFEGLSGDGTATMAHIHYGPDTTMAGPVMIWLTPVGVPDGSVASPISGTATEAEFMPVEGGPQTFAEALDAIRAGDTYVNVHTAANPGGEIRGQLMPADDLPPTDTANELPLGGLTWISLLALAALAVVLVATRRFLARLG